MPPGSDAGRVPADLVDHAIDLASRRQRVPGVDTAFLETARSVLRHLVRRTHLQEAMRAVTVPVLLLQGDRDRLVPLAAAQQAAADHPHWELQVARGVGHVPMLEAPEWFLATYRDWGERPGSAVLG